MFKDKLNFKLLNILILLVIIYICLITMGFWGGFISKMFSIVSPFLIAFAIAYAFSPIVRKLEAKGVRKGLAVTAVVSTITISMIALVALTIPLVYEQLITLSKLIGDVMTDFSSKFAVNLGGFDDSINDIVNDLIAGFGKYVSSGTIDLVGKSLSFFTNFIIIYIVSIYFLAGMDNIRASIKSLVKKRSSKVFYYLKAVDKELGNYLQGLTIFIIVQFFEYSFLFWIIGHPNWLLLGILASVTTVVPYFGGLITNIIAVILASVISSQLFIATLFICLVFPNIDGYVISPKIYGKTNNINPLWVIFAVMVGGSLFGIVGIIISLPIYIILDKTYKFFKDDIKDKIVDIKTNKAIKK